MSNITIKKPENANKLLPGICIFSDDDNNIFASEFIKRGFIVISITNKDKIELIDTIKNIECLDQERIVTIGLGKHGLDSLEFTKSCDLIKATITISIKDTGKTINNLEEIKTPVLVVHSSIDSNQGFGLSIYHKLVGENKTYLVIPDEVHADLSVCNKVNHIPFDYLEKYIKKHIK